LVVERSGARSEALHRCVSERHHVSFARSACAKTLKIHVWLPWDQGDGLIELMPKIAELAAVLDGEDRTKFEKVRDVTGTCRILESRFI
jgi:hypothetical protein